MPFDNYVVGAVVKELSDKLVSGRVERIYQPEKDEIILCINTPPPNAGRHNLLLSANSSHPVIYLTETKQVNPENPPAFCMLLRKHLLSGRVKAVKQVPDERIVKIEFSSSSELGEAIERTVVFELMGRHSNIVLLKEDGVIADAIKRISGDVSRVRQTLPGMKWTLPPKGKGLSPIMEEELALGFTDPRGHTHLEFDEMAAKGEYAPTIYFSSTPDTTFGNAVDFHVFKLLSYDGLQYEDFSSVSHMLETFYESKETAIRVNAKTAELGSILKAALDKLYLKKQRLNEDLLAANRADEFRKKGDLVTSNIYRIAKGDKFLLAPDYEALSGLPDDKGMIEGVPEIKIGLDPLLSPSANAQRYYKKYTKMRDSIAFKEDQLAITEDSIDYLESVEMFLSRAQKPVEIDELRSELISGGFLRARNAKARAKAKGGGLRKFSPTVLRTSLGTEVLIGHNNIENDELTMRRALKTDIWLHTKDIPGSHVILRVDTVGGFGGDSSGASEPAAEDILEAAAFAAYYSKASDSENVPVDYCRVKYVKKPNGAKPGMVIFTHNKTVYVTPKKP
ncbi:MAG: NFACT family protein [Clostridiales Family XIII bacterium]|jgi:predicted ribosome quality control (RQC) complex YloA/Tae2 family protein|nr:NFACT family protein [Clostridiales Family XIII bacterium]